MKHTWAQILKQTQLTKYTQQNGLSSFNIHKIVQDPFGFIWVATQDGLNQFDGKSFTEYNKNKSEGRQIITVDCRDVYIDSLKGMLWVLMNEGGLNAINCRTGKVEKTITRESLNPDDWAISFEYAGSRLWIGTGSGLSIYNIETDQFEKSPLDHLLINLTSRKKQIRLCKRDSFNNIWVCINGVGIVIMSSSTLEILKIIPTKQLNDFSRTGIIQFFSATQLNHTLLFGTSLGLRAIKFDRNYNVLVNNDPSISLPFLNAAAVNWIDKGLDGRIYISAGGLFSVDTAMKNPIKYSEISSETSAWLDNIYTGCFVDNNLVFIGCKEGLGLMKLSDPPFESIKNNTTLTQKLGHVYAVWPFKEDSIIAATNSGLYLIENKTKITTIRNDGFYQNISPLTQSSVIVSNNKGLSLFNGHEMLPLSQVYKELEEYQLWEINSCVKLNDSIFVLGTENFSGIVLWDHKNKRTTPINQHTSPLKLEADIVNALYKDRRNNLWVLSDKAITIINYDLSKYHALKFTDSVSGLPVSLFFDMCQVGDDFWLATYSVGIIQLDATYRIKKIYTTENGLCNNGVYKIFNVENRNLIITTNNGLSVFNLSDQTFSNYYQQDGLHSNAFEEACGVYRNNKIYVGGVNGLTIIDPEKISENKTPPQLYIRNVEINIEIETSSARINVTDLAIKRINIPNNFSQVKVHFAALNYLNPARITYSYKITELHHEWINLGTQNFITLVGAPPGTYHLHVRAYNENGVPSKIKELILVFQPKLYQTWWFKLLLVLLGTVFIYILYRSRINQLKQVQKIRNKLASDLHDDLGSTMNSVKIYANLAMNDKQSNNYLLKVKESIQETITGLRDMIWVLDDKKQTIEHLLIRLSTFAVPLCDAYNIFFKQEIADDAREHKLGPDERRNLYMIIKEAINNAVKYSEGSKIEITISLKQNKPKIIITDNGKGFDTSKKMDGYGLNNMIKRAKEIQYQIQIESEFKRGTTVQLKRI